MLPSENHSSTNCSKIVHFEQINHFIKSYNWPSTQREATCCFTPYSLYFDLLNIPMNHYINRLSRCIKAQKKLGDIVKTALQLSNDSLITKIALQEQWKSTSHHAFNHWHIQLTILQWQLLLLLMSAKSSQRYYPLRHNSMTIHSIMEEQYEFPEPLYLILSGTLKWPMSEIRPFSSLWTTNRVTKGRNSTTQHLLSTPIDLVLIDIDYADKESLNLCRYLRTQHFTAPILAIIIDNNTSNFLAIKQSIQLADINDYCNWPLTNQSWEAWINHWLPNRMTTISYVKRIK